MLNLRGVTLLNQEVPAIDLKALVASLGRNIDGILGYDVSRPHAHRPGRSGYRLTLI